LERASANLSRSVQFEFVEFLLRELSHAGNATTGRGNFQLFLGEIVARNRLSLSVFLL
jgi:hypothetical protein